MMTAVSEIIAQELQVSNTQVSAAIELLDKGDTVPFIARYRKEVTQGLDDTQLRTLEERLHYLRELNERRQVIFKEITNQNKMTPELEASIIAADNKARLEDLYKPYKPKRRTRAQIAIEAGHLPLAEKILADQSLDPTQIAEKEALEGAKYIIMERWAEDANLIGSLRDKYWQHGVLTSKVKKDQEEKGKKFSDYFEYSEKLSAIPSHRALAVLRGRNTEVLQINIEADYPFETDIAQYFTIENSWLLEVVHWTWKVKLKTQLEIELITRLREHAEQQAMQVFAANLRDLLMLPPAGMHVALGLDPGFRTGVKMAVVDATGKLLHHGTIFPHQPKAQWDLALQLLEQVCKQFSVKLISIGNGTASRETDQLVAELIKAKPELGLSKIVISEAGASVYSASKVGAAEFPDLDVSFRGAVSIARRLQDPLAELVKIEPKAIGVGQYQHDVNQTQLERALNAVVEDCVNTVGVDVNTASVALLTHVAGLNQQLAENIVSYRDQNGQFSGRQQLHKVSRLGPKAFEQAAGFLRIMHGDNPLDSSAVHPESYPLVERITKDLSKDVKELISNKQLLATIDPKVYVDSDYGLPTITDILSELEKPGRDPRPEFKTAQFEAHVTSIGDLKPGMILEGVVTNVANFGAFVDIGVHQDGLVHISHLSENFVSDPRSVVRAGQIIKVKVTEVDLDRKRISLSMRLKDPETPSTGQQKRAAGEKDSNKGKPDTNTSGKNRKPKQARNKPVSMFGDALRAAIEAKET